MTGTTRKHFAGVVAGLFFFVGAVWAADQENAPKPIKASLLIGIKVEHPNGESLGYIEDVVLDAKRERVSYAVLSSGGFLGVADKRFCVPWSAFEFNPSAQTLSFPVEKQTLKDSQGASRDDWPDAGDEKWARLAAQYRGQEYKPDKALMPNPSSNRENEKQFATRRISKVLGMNVYNRDGERLGEIENLILQGQDGIASYAVLSVDTPGPTINPKHAPVPWTALSMRPRLGTALLNADRQTLSNIAFEGDLYPDLSDPSLAQRLRETFHIKPRDLTRAEYKKSDSTRTGEAEPWNTDSEYNRNFNPRNVTTIECTVDRIEMFQPAHNAAHGLQLTVRTDTTDYTVHVGPRSFVSENGVRFDYGDDLKITGSIVTHQDQEVLIASRIERTSDGAVLKLRKESGDPLWSPNQVK